MKKIILAIATIFVFAALIPNIQPEGEADSFHAYFWYAIHFISQNYFIFILGFILLIVLFIRSVNFDKNYPHHKKFSLASFQVMNAFIVGIFLSYAILLLIAFTELNILSISTLINRNILGIISDTDAIVKTLKKTNYPPQIMAGDKGQNRELVAVARTFTGTDNFYGKYVLSSIPSFLVIPTKFDSSVLLVDNTLIITQLNAKDLEKISPTVSYLLIQKYFLQRKIKSYPDISIMSEQEYKTFRKANFEESLQKISKEIEKYEKQKEATASSLEETKSKLTYYKNLVETSTSTRDTAYRKCLANGKSTLDSCKNILNQYKDISSQNELITALNLRVSSDESKLKEFEEYYNFYTTLGKSVKVLTENVPHELGLFLPKKTIKIVFSTTNSHRIADYLDSLVHEYLHYASYTSDDKKLSDAFFEEGLTEYFAKQIISDDLNVSTNVGYPIFAKIITQMTKRIPESDFEEIYFTKDQNKLEGILDKVYGENFYKNTRLQFLTLQYSTNPKEALQVANDIMKKIGGEPLKEKDLFNSSSDLN
jgi:hypothetical protein